MWDKWPTVMGFGRAEWKHIQTQSARFPAKSRSGRAVCVSRTAPRSQSQRSDPPAPRPLDERRPMPCCPVQIGGNQKTGYNSAKPHQYFWIKTYYNTHACDPVVMIAGGAALALSGWVRFTGVLAALASPRPSSSESPHFHGLLSLVSPPGEAWARAAVRLTHASSNRARMLFVSLVVVTGHNNWGFL